MNHLVKMKKEGSMHWRREYEKGWRQFLGPTGKQIWKCCWEMLREKRTIVKLNFVTRKNNWIGHLVRGEGLL